jgi:hypothetical protein
MLKKPGNSVDSPSIILTAPTGKAAVHIGGTTLHNAFRLPVKKRGGYEHKHQSAASLNSMRSVYCGHGFIFDEGLDFVSLPNMQFLIQMKC